MGRTASHAKAPDARLKRLAESIEALADKDEEKLRQSRRITALRKAAAAELHRICAQFVDSLNRLLSTGELDMDPPVFSEEAFQEDSHNLFQINVRGRILQAGPASNNCARDREASTGARGRRGAG